jgi:hypothetical protein
VEQDDAEAVAAAMVSLRPPAETAAPKVKRRLAPNEAEADRDAADGGAHRPDPRQ